MLPLAARRRSPRLQLTLLALGLGTVSLAVAREAGAACLPAALPVTSATWTTLGNGTPGSVTPASLQAAVTAGGFVRFDLGAAPVTLTLTAELQVTRAVTIDGGGRVTLSGGGTTRLMRITNPQNATFTVTLQHLTLADGAAPAGDGAAIDKATGGPWQAVSLTLVDCIVRDNTAIASAQDGGGGGIYATGMDVVRIHGCRFENNRGSNGGAIYSLGSRRLHVTDSLFLANRATGSGGNPGNGGNGGAIGVDGASREVEMCGVRFYGNQGNAYGAAFFSVAYDTASPTDFRFATFDSNFNPTAQGFAGAVYLQGGPFSIRQSLFRANEANGVGALFLGPGASGEIANSTFTENVARQSLAGAMAVNTSAPVTIASSTIAGNQAPGAVAFAGGIRVDEVNDLTLTDTLLANNTGGNVWNPWNILHPAAHDGGGNVEWPRFRPNGQEEVRATPTTLWADPLLGSPESHGGPTETMALALASPARGAAAGSPSDDQRGAPRTAPFDSGACESDLLFVDGFEWGSAAPWGPAVP